jgi:putative NIF3 family GTP cyclohydrolase 1 type 2
VEQLAETRVEMVVPHQVRAQVIAALRAAHPYEEPAFDLLRSAALPGSCGTGRVGELAAAMTLAEFVAHAAAVLPATAWGLRAAGHPGRTVRTVAVCGGSGGGLAEHARRAGADAYLTADLKHHPVVEAVTERGGDGMALVDAAHWATEAPWLDAVADALRERFGTSVDVRVSREITDPWTLHVPSPEASQH